MVQFLGSTSDSLSDNSEASDNIDYESFNTPWNAACYAFVKKAEEARYNDPDYDSSDSDDDNDKNENENSTSNKVKTEYQNPYDATAIRNLIKLGYSLDTMVISNDTINPVWWPLMQEIVMLGGFMPDSDAMDAIKPAMLDIYKNPYVHNNFGIDLEKNTKLGKSFIEPIEGVYAPIVLKDPELLKEWLKKGGNYKQPLSGGESLTLVEILSDSSLFRHDEKNTAKLLDTLLQEHPKEADHKDKDGVPVIYKAVITASIDSIEILLKHKVKTDYHDKNGNNLISALIMSAAIPEMKLKILQLFDKYDALKPLINGEDLEQSIPLHKAVYIAEPNIVKFLTDHSANTNHKNKKQRTPIDLCLAKIHAEEVRLKKQGEKTSEKLQNLMQIHKLFEVPKLDRAKSASLDDQENTRYNANLEKQTKDLEKQFEEFRKQTAQQFAAMMGHINKQNDRMKLYEKENENLKKKVDKNTDTLKDHEERLKKLEDQVYRIWDEIKELRQLENELEEARKDNNKNNALSPIIEKIM